MAAEQSGLTQTRAGRDRAHEVLDGAFHATGNGVSDSSVAENESPPRPEREPERGAERRAHPRHAVDCPVRISPLSGASSVLGKIVDLSLGGCRAETSQALLAGIMMRVEVQFELRGIAFRVVGVTVGSRSQKRFAIRFLEISERRQRDLVEVLAEVEAINLAKAASESSGDVQENSADLMHNSRPENNQPAALAPAADSVPPPVKPALPVESVPAPPASQPARPVDRRRHDRHSVDTRVQLLLVKTNICRHGRILNLSQGGCRLRTDERFEVGIFVRVETEFYLHGLPFRLAGVTQTIMDKHTIGVRFLDMSDRKREQLTTLIAEIEEAEAASAAHPLPSE